MRYIKSLLPLTALLLFLLLPKSAFSSEGTIELDSTSSEYNFRCYAASIQMMNRSFQIPVTCRQLVYPAGDNVFTYVVWAEPLDGGKPIKLGELGLGRATFKTNKRFSSLYVTTESNKKTRSPEGPTVMEGFVERIEFLDEMDTFETIQPEPEFSEIAPTASTPSPTLSSRQRLVTGLKRAGLVIGVALITIIGLVFVLTRSRR